MSNELETRTIEERVSAGELVWFRNYGIEQGLHEWHVTDTDDGTEYGPVTEQHEFNMIFLGSIREQYGREAVIIGQPFDPETGMVSDNKGELGAYVTAQAYNNPPGAAPDNLK